MTVWLSNTVGKAPSSRQLDKLRELAHSEFDGLLPLYSEFNGVVFHAHRGTSGLFVAPIDQLQELNREWRDWFSDLDTSDLYEFQRDGFAFATIVRSGNYFVMHRGKVYYADHDGGDDAVWGEDLEHFFRRALTEPARFLLDVGCYTRYSDGESDIQWIPERFVHD